MRAGEADQASTSERLLQALAEQLKLPLVQIARATELTQTTGELELLPTIEAVADSALHFIDSYLLSNQLLHSQQPLLLEPISVPAVLHNAAASLQALARQYHCDLEVQLSQTMIPVMAHAPALTAALAGLGQVMIRASAQQSEGQSQRISLVAHRTRGGVVTGVFAPIEGLNQGVLRAAKRFYGQTRQPLHNALHDSGAGVFVADSILSAMSARLRVARHHNLTGLAATLLPSRQLQII